MTDCTYTLSGSAERDDEILSHGVRTIRNYRGSIHNPIDPISEPSQEVLHVLVSAAIDPWGQALPHGLTDLELSWATRLTRQDVLQGIAALYGRPADRPCWRVYETKVDGFRRYSVRSDEAR